MLDPDLLHLSREVTRALKSSGPIVALESTVIAHGLPRIVNLEAAYRLEEEVRSGGATPATIAILNGRLHVGLESAELERIAKSEEVQKVSIRDLAIAVTERWDGATTVASSIWIARRAGIPVFATGGIGGVHRGSLPDVSADLPELARNSTVVVCSGAKIILDLPATREWLETHGVPVIGYGCDEMPAFYVRRSGLPVDFRADTPEMVAQLARTRRRLGLEEAMLVTVPVPAEAEVPETELQEMLARALVSAERDKIAGRHLTPYLLSQISKLSAGTTLRANIALLENNARVAAEIALAFSQVRD